MDPIAPTDPWDNMHSPSAPGLHWSTDNVGEACPGVVSPLTASFWGEIGEATTRGAFLAVGVLTPAEAVVPARIDDRVVRLFCGRMALQIELMTMVGDRLPGTSGRETAGSMLG
jgi:pyruvate,water dikinase